MDGYGWHNLWVSAGIGSPYTGKISVTCTKESGDYSFYIGPGNNWIENPALETPYTYTVTLKVTKQAEIEITPRGKVLFEGTYTTEEHFGQATKIGISWSGSDYAYTGFKPQELVEGCEFYVFYTSEKTPNLSFQSNTQWKNVSATLAKDGVAQYTYENGMSALISDGFFASGFSDLCVINISADGSALTVTKVMFYTPNPTAIGEAEGSSAEVVKTEYFSLSGARVAEPVKGVNIVKRPWATAASARRRESSVRKYFVLVNTVRKQKPAPTCLGRACVVFIRGSALRLRALRAWRAVATARGLRGRRPCRSRGRSRPPGSRQCC